MARTRLTHSTAIGLSLLLTVWCQRPVSSQERGGTTPDTAHAQRADTASRTGQAGSGVTAGYNRGFFIRSDDGNNELRIVLVGQLRYIYNHRTVSPSTATDDDLDRGGIQLRRVQLDLQGHFLNPRWTFRMRLDASSGGVVGASWAWVGYRFTDRFGIRVGQLKPSFLYEENVGGPSQLAVERSYTADYFTTDFSQGLQLTAQPARRLRLVGTLHTGSYSSRTDFLNDGTDLALAGRVELLLGGGDIAKAWRQFADFNNWSDGQRALLLSGACDYEWGESQPGGATPDVWKCTVDGVGKLGRLSLFGSGIVQGFSVTDPAAEGVPAALGEALQLGAVAQASYFVVRDRVEPFARYERIIWDGVFYRNVAGIIESVSGEITGSDALSILTAGLNCYILRHTAKLTLDVVYVFDAVPALNIGDGLLASASGDQYAVRSQLQVQF